MIKIPIPAELERITSPDNNKTIASAEGIYDYLKSKNQLTINAEVDNTLSSIQERLTETEVNSGDLNIDLRIDDKINELDSSTSGSWSNDGTVISVSINQSNGKVSNVSINVLNIASITLLLTLQSTIEALSGYIGLNNINITLRVVPSRPETGETNIVYRVTGESSYSDWMYNPELPQESRWILLATYGNAADNEPLPTSDNLIKSKGVANTCGYTSDSNEGWIYTIKDAEDKILFGIKSDGSINWYVGMPAHLKDYILENAYKWLKEEESEEFLYKITDAEDKILFGIKLDGEIYNSNIDPKIISYINKKVLDTANSSINKFYSTEISEPIFTVDNNLNIGLLGVCFNHYNNYMSVGVNDTTNPNVIQGKNYDWCEAMSTYAKNLGADVVRMDFYSWRDHGTTTGLSDEERLKVLLDYYKNPFYIVKKHGLKILATYSPHQNGHWATVKDRMWDPIKKKYTWDGYLEFEKKAFLLLASKNLGLCPDGSNYSIDGLHEPLDITPDFIELTNEFDIENSMYQFRWNGEFNEKGERIYDDDVKAQNWFNFWKMAYTTIKETNPNIKVFMGGLAGLTNGTLERMAKITDEEGHRFWDFFDIYNFHSYDSVDELYSTIANHLLFMISSLKYKGKTRFIDKPVVITEYGANYFDNTEEYIADSYPKKTIILQASGILTCFPFKLMSMERALYNNAWPTNASRYGLIHEGLNNSTIAFLRNDGSNTAINNGSWYDYMKFSQYNGVKMMALKVVNANMISRLRNDGLIIKKLGNYTILEVRVYNNPSDVYLSSGNIKLRNLGTNIYLYLGEALSDTLTFNKDNFSRVVTNSVIIVIGGDDVDTSNTWNHNVDLAKPSYKVLQTYVTKFHDEYCTRPVVTLTDEGIYVARWLNKNKETIYAIWSTTRMKDVRAMIDTYGCPVIYDQFGEVIIDANKYNLDISSVNYLTNAGNIKVKRV